MTRRLQNKMASSAVNTTEIYKDIPLTILKPKLVNVNHDLVCLLTKCIRKPRISFINIDLARLFENLPKFTR